MFCSHLGICTSTCSACFFWPVAFLLAKDHKKSTHLSSFPSSASLSLMCNLTKKKKYSSSKWYIPANDLTSSIYSTEQNSVFLKAETVTFMLNPEGWEGLCPVKSQKGGHLRQRTCAVSLKQVRSAGGVQGTVSTWFGCNQGYDGKGKCWHEVGKGHLLVNNLSFILNAVKSHWSF